VEPARRHAPSQARPSATTDKVGEKEIFIDRPYVVEELCVGCGFCENVCPVPGEAAIRVEGPAGVARIAEEAAAPAAGVVFPAAIGGWELRGKAATYVGPNGLFEYIDGAGEPYLTYDFKQVTAATYKQGKMELQVDLWFFGSPPEAFGAFSRDSSFAAASSENLGHRAASAEGELWVWHGSHYLHITSLGSKAATRAQMVEVARALVARLPEEKPDLPAIVGRLPEAGRLETSIHYFHDPLAGGPRGRAGCSGSIRALRPRGEDGLFDSCGLVSRRGEGQGGREPLRETPGRQAGRGRARGDESPSHRTKWPRRDGGSWGLRGTGPRCLDAGRGRRGGRGARIVAEVSSRREDGPWQSVASAKSDSQRNV